MKTERQTVTFNELEEGEKYFSSTAGTQEVIEVLLKQDDRIIFESDDKFDHVETYFRKDWNPNRWKPVDDTYNGPSLNDQ